MTTAVHELVARALARLDPAAEVKTTSYFNHSFVPDLVMSWTQGGERVERYVHLRFSVIARPFEHDIQLLGGTSPVFIGMTDRQPLREATWSTARTNGTLVTQSAAIDDLDTAVREDPRSRSATAPIVRRGRGLLDESRAEDVSRHYFAALRDIEEDEGQPAATVTSALETLRGLLPEGAELEVERALQSEWIRHGRDPHDFPGRDPWRPELLDRATLREVLLSLLDSARSVAAETWVKNAGFVSAEDIGEVIGRDLYSGAFDAMAHALLPYWTAKWVWAERVGSPPIEQTYAWLLERSILGLQANDLRIFFADDGRHFKDKAGDNVLPRLDEAQAMLAEPGIQTVGLRTAREGIRYEPLSGAGPLYERLRQVLSESGVGDYRLQSVTAQVPGTPIVGDVDMGRQHIDLRGQATPVAKLAQLAVRFFSRAPLTEGFEEFLATGSLTST